MKKIIVLLMLLFFSFTTLAATCTIAVSAPSNVTADFSATPVSGAAPLQVQFTDNSIVNSGGRITSWQWNFGDGTTSSQQKPLHTYNNAGSYSVSLTVKNNIASNTATKSNYITVTNTLKPPVAAFTASPVAGNVPLTVTFADRSTGSPASWSWNFGDGVTSNVQSPSHTYNTAGTFTVSLTVTNSGGSNTRSSTINVSSAPATAVVADFRSNVSSGRPPLTVQFNDNSNGNPTIWNWNFGDAGTSNVQNPTHTFYNAGTYAVILIAGSGTSWSTATKYITVGNGLQAAFTASPSQGEVPLTVQFTDASIGSPTAWFWDFGDGNNSTIQNPFHIYNQTGSYAVKLTVSNSIDNNTSQANFLVNISSASTFAANFSSNLTSGVAPLTVQFNDLSTGNPTNWSWDFGDGNNSTDKNPIHTYSNAGNYSVTLSPSNTNHQDTLTLPDYIVVTSESGDSGDGSSDFTGTSSLTGSGTSPEPASNIAVKVLTQRFVAGGNHIKFDFSKNATSINFIEFDAKKTLGKTTTTIEQLKERSVLTSTDPEGKVYKYLNIWVGNNGISIPENIGNATIGFLISKNETQLNDTEKSAVILQRYAEGEWNPLKTIKTGEDDEYIYYLANTPGFSPFAITSSEVNSTEENVNQTIENITQPNQYNGELSIQNKQPKKSDAASSTDWHKYSGTIRFFVLFIVVLFIGLVIREKRK